MDKLIQGEGNGGTQCSLHSLVSQGKRIGKEGGKGKRAGEGKEVKEAEEETNALTYELFNLGM